MFKVYFEAFKVLWLIYVTPALTLMNSTFCAHGVFLLNGSLNKQR